MAFNSGQETIGLHAKTCSQRFAFASVTALTAVVMVMAACTPGKPVPPDGTRRMADTLAAMYQRALASPQANPFLNRERAVAIQRELTAQGGAFDREGEYLLAQERLTSGETREAIALFEQIIGPQAMNSKRIDPQTKVLFDFLALSWMRLGEQENCRVSPAANVCILPLAGAAKHQLQEGARKSISVYKALLFNFPDDLGSRWLLNIAYMAIGGYPDSVPAPYLIRGIMPKPDATFPLFQNVAPLVGVAVDGLSGGVAIEDFQSRRSHGSVSDLMGTQ